MPGQMGMAGIVAALSVTSDLARGHPPGEAMRACLLATELGRRAGLDALRQGDVYYATLLRFAGCTATSHEIATTLGGDDIVVRARGDLVDASRPEEALRFVAFLAGLGEGAGRLRVIANLPRVAGARRDSARADCEVGANLVKRLRLPAAVHAAILDGFERFDGRGAPEGKSGLDIAEASRYAAVGYAAVMFDAVGGRDVATQTVRRWAGRALDPAVVAVFDDSPDELLALSDPDELHAAVVDAEPRPAHTFADDAAIDEALSAFGDAADLKTPWLSGHSRGVARLTQAAAEHFGSIDPSALVRAAMLHDLGRVAVPTGVWEREGPLRRDEWELVRMHPYHTERILMRAPSLAPLARIASRHHERIDGSGYPAGVGASELDASARLLAVAEVLQALSEPRPHRAALDPAAASRTLSSLPLDRDSIRAVLAAAGAPPPRLPPLPADLSERELAVLRLLVAGRTERQIASALVVSPSTVHTHTVHIYAKCGVSTRAGLAMFAMQHGLAAGPRQRAEIN